MLLSMREEEVVGDRRRRKLLGVKSVAVLSFSFARAHLKKTDPPPSTSKSPYVVGKEKDPLNDIPYTFFLRRGKWSWTDIGTAYTVQYFFSFFRLFVHTFFSIRSTYLCFARTFNSFSYSPQKENLSYTPKGVSPKKSLNDLSRSWFVIPLDLKRERGGVLKFGKRERKSKFDPERIAWSDTEEEGTPMQTWKDLHSPLFLLNWQKIPYKCWWNWRIPITAAVAWFVGGFFFSEDRISPPAAKHLPSLQKRVFFREKNKELNLSRTCETPSNENFCNFAQLY